MVNPEHLALILTGGISLNRWIKQNPKISLDLSGAKMPKKTFSDLNLSGANLKDADFNSSIFFSTKFVGANLEKATLVCTRALKSDFTLANLTNADLRGSLCYDSNFTGCILEKADLFSSNMSYSKFMNANLKNANLSGVNFAGANLTDADLSNADLIGTLFDESFLFQTSFENAKMMGAIFVNCDLSMSKGLASAKHNGGSSVDFATISKTFNSSGKRLTADFSKFLVDIGLPKEFIEYLPKIICNVQYLSCFISYGEPDKQFAIKLREALILRGINCWIYALDSTPGEITWSEISKRRRTSEKMILLCSIKSLIRDGVKKEIEEQIDEDESKIIPVSLDNDWKNVGFEVKRGSNDLKPFLLRRNYADFSVESYFAETVSRLINALKVDKNK